MAKPKYSLDNKIDISPFLEDEDFRDLLKTSLSNFSGHLGFRSTSLLVFDSGDKNIVASITSSDENFDIQAVHFNMKNNRMINSLLEHKRPISVSCDQISDLSSFCPIGSRRYVLAPLLKRVAGNDLRIGILLYSPNATEKRPSHRPDAILDILSETVYQGYMVARLRKRVDDVSSISEISREILHQDIDEVLKRILDIALERVNAVSGSIMLVNKGMLEAHYAKGKGIRKNFWDIKFRIGYGAAGYVAKTAKPLLIKNKLEDRRYVDTGTSTASKSSYFGIPFVFRGEVLGVMNIDFKSEHELSEECIDFLMILASSASVAIRNTQLYSSHMKRMWKLSAMYEITKKISATLDLEKVLDLIVIKIIKLLNANICSVYLLNKEKTFLVPKSVYSSTGHHLHRNNIEVKNSMSGRAILTKNIIYSEDITKEPMFYDKEFMQKQKLKSFLSVPLVIDNNGIGVINIYSKRKRDFSDDEIDLISSFADQAAIAIEKAILYRHIKGDREKLTKILEASHEISSTLDFNRLLDLIIKRTMEISNAKAAALLLLDKNMLTIYGSYGYNKKEASKIKLKVGEGITGWVAKTGKPLIINDVLKDKRYYDAFPNQKSEAAFPILIRGKVFGVLNLDSSSYNAFERHKDTIEILMDRVAVAIENSMLHKKTENFNIKLKEKVKSATKNLLDANRRLVKLDEMKSDFVSNVSHELRTPLTSIMGYSKLLNSEKLGGLNDQQRKSLNIIVEESERLTRLINDILDLSKLERGSTKLNLAECDMNSIIKGVSYNMGSLASEKGIEVMFELQELPNVFVDEDKIRQVLYNLLSNAIKFTDKGGKITISSMDERRFIRISVKDTGRGIEKENIPKLFDKFYQVDPSLTKVASGSGLGLPIAQYIVRMHGGYISVKSQMKKGSTFSFTLSKEMKKYST